MPAEKTSALVIDSEEKLIAAMTTPTPEVIEAVGQLDGDILILGVAGKLGPTLAELLLRAGARRVIGVSRFSDTAVESYLQEIGVETVRGDLLSAGTLAALPPAPYVYNLAGFKFGASSQAEAMWAVNALLSARIVERFHSSRIVYLSSGNVYPFTDETNGGASEDTTPDPVGEYAQSRLGGERLAAWGASEYGTRLFIVRLFYATELRYGILHDIGLKVSLGEAIDLSMGYVNQIWQGDVNAYLARSFPLCSNPPTILNMAGPAVLSVRDLALQLGAYMGKEPVFSGTEHPTTALLGDAARLTHRLGVPPTPIGEILRWVADWIRLGGRDLGRPTKYESRSGRF